MFRNGCVIKRTAQLRQICCPPSLSNLKDRHQWWSAVKVKWLYFRVHTTDSKNQYM